MIAKRLEPKSGSRPLVFQVIATIYKDLLRCLNFTVYGEFATETDCIFFAAHDCVAIPCPARQKLHTPSRPTAGFRLKRLIKTLIEVI